MKIGGNLPKLTFIAALAALPVAGTIPASSAATAPEPPKSKTGTKAAPATSGPAKSEKNLDLDALAASLTKLNEQPARPAIVAQAPLRPGAAAISGLAEALQRRWRPDCETDGGRNAVVRVVFTIDADGQVVGDVASEIRSVRNAASQAAASRAVSAVRDAAPYRNLPQEFYGKGISVNFNAREACS